MDVIRRSLDKTIISIENLVNYPGKLLRTQSLQAVEMPEGFLWLQCILLTFLGSHRNRSLLSLWIESLSGPLFQALAQ